MKVGDLITWTQKSDTSALDFDKDGVISVIDFNNFIVGWQSKDMSYELAPINGTAPFFKPTMDGLFNLRDGMAFYQMWHWNHEGAGKLMTKVLSQIGQEANVSFDNNNLVFNLANTKQNISILNLAKLLIKIANKKIQIKIEKCNDNSYLKSPIEYLNPSTDKLNSLGWSPKISIEDGFKRIFKIKLI